MRKGVFFGEHEDESVIKIKSLYANFLEEKFPTKGEMSWDSDFYNLNESTPSCRMEQEDFEPTLPGNSKSCTPMHDVMPPS